MQMAYYMWINEIIEKKSDNMGTGKYGSELFEEQSDLQRE